MSNNLTSAVPTQTFVECSLCKGSVNISWFCKNCISSLCDVCIVTHKTTQQHKDHTVVPRTYTVLRLYGPAKLAEQCTIHPDKEISLYCNECDVPCCVTCMVKDHKRHDLSTIEDKYLDAEKGLNDYNRLLDTDIKPALDKIKKQAKVDVKEIKTHVEKVANDIDTFRKTVVDDFNNACDHLIVQVRETERRDTERLREIENAIKNVETIKKENEKVVAKGKLDLIRYAPPKIESHVPKSVFSDNVVPYFDPSRVLDVIHQSVGKIEYKDLKNKKKVTVNVQRKKSFISTLGATSMTSASNNKVWFMNYSCPKVLLHDDKGTIVDAVTVEDGVGINDMAITQSGEIIITCEDKKVRRMINNVTWNVYIMIDTAPMECKGVCLTEKEEIVVCLRDQNHVAVYSPDGKSKLREIRGKDDQGNNLISNPYRVAHKGQHLYVVNATNNVVCVEERGDKRWMYDGEQAKLDGTFNPRCICVSQYHSLLVTDSMNHCVHHIDKVGRLIQVILTHEQIGLKCPLGICVDNATEQVWVGSNNDKKVAIAKFSLN